MPEFNAGAMENPGLVTFRDEYVFRSAVTPTEAQWRAVVIAHEMAHMWFGDLVTLRWWDDIWLNESFAEYMGYQVISEATAFADTWTDFGVSRKAWGSDADQRPSTHPVAPDPEAVPDTASALNNFDGISYAKGASALRQLVAWMGRKDFLAGINEHFARHRFGNASLADFLDSLVLRDRPRRARLGRRAGCVPTGLDTLTPSASPAPGGWRLEVGHTGGRPHRIGVGLYDRAVAEPGRLVLRDRITLDLAAGSAVERRELPGPAPRPDPAQRRRPELCEGPLRRALLGDGHHLARRVPDPLSRAVAWNAARDLVRDARVAPAVHLDLVTAHLPAETDPAIVEGVLTFARTAVADRFLAPELRPDALAGLAETGRGAARRRPARGPGWPPPAPSSDAAVSDAGRGDAARLVRAGRHSRRARARPRAALAAAAAAVGARRGHRRGHRRRTRPRPQRHRRRGRGPLPRGPAGRRGQGGGLGVALPPRLAVQLPLRRHRAGLLAAGTGRTHPGVRAALLSRTRSPSPPGAGRPSRT